MLSMCFHLVKQFTRALETIKHRNKYSVLKQNLVQYCLNREKFLRLFTFQWLHAHMADAKYFILIYSCDLIKMIYSQLFRDLKFIETKLHILHEENNY